MKRKKTEKEIKNGLAAYRVLRERVREVLILGQRQIDAFKVQTYWRAGSYINEHVRLNGNRAEHGRQVLLKLGRDLDLDESVLRRSAEFAEKFPDLEIRATWHELPGSPRQIEKSAPRNLLSWSHYRLLITVEDERRRYGLAERAKRSGWTVERLERAIWNLKPGSKLKALPSAKGADQTNLLTPQLGRLDTYRLIQPSKIHWPAASGLLLDHGFKSYTWLHPGKARGFHAEEIVEEKEGRLLKSERSARDLFTYLAYVDRIIDADTLWVALDVGLSGVSRQKLRLRDIDAPELDTAAGRRAYEFLKSTLAKAPFLMVRSYKNDKYDRYETDLFIPAEGAGARNPRALGLSDLVFINNLLLETGHAVLVRED